MDALLPDLLELLSEHGLWLLFLLAVAETSFVTGLVVPSGLATSAATVLALEGVLPLPAVAVVAAAGGWCGDVIGYWVGRLGRARIEASSRPWARSLRGGDVRAARFFGRHPAFSVSLARLVSFVRTLMPMAAGMSGMGQRRFLLYEAPGLAGWLAIYVGIGVLAEESWEAATRVVGLGWTVVFVVVGLVLWFGRARKRAAGRAGRSPDAAPPARPRG